MKIVTVIVTYNRLSLLPECITAVKNQTYNIDKILVVNNGSTDGTKEWLDNQNGLIVIHQDNVGGAGGFHTGIKYAYDSAAEWIWVMDDDVFPEPFCLENLLKYSSVSKCLQPNRYYSDGKLKIWNKYFSLKQKKMFHYDQTGLNDKEFSFVNTGCFEGMLIHKEIVEKIGFPDARFFISGDDTIYGYLANIHTNICLVRDAKMKRAKKSTEELLSPMYVYYSYRNFHLFEEYYTKYFNKESYPLKIQMKYYMTGIYSCLLILISIKYTPKVKFRLIQHILKGVFDSYKKCINKSL